MARVVVWRIARRPYALDRAGTGARHHGGRWNHPGTGVIYAGRTVGIAALETFVHVAGVVPPDLVLVRIELPEHCSTEEPALTGLPAHWGAVPIRPASMDFGTRWVREKRSLILHVPSALIREEGNAVLNPDHPEFEGVNMSIEREFRFDPRMYLPRTPPGRG